MDCKTFIQSMDDYLDGALEGAQRLAMEEHLKTCPQCRALLEQARQVLACCGEVGLADRAPEGFVSQVMAQVKKEADAAKRRGRRRITALCGAAAGLAVVVLGGTLLLGSFGGRSAASSEPQVANAMYATASAPTMMSFSASSGSGNDSAADGMMAAEAMIAPEAPAPAEAGALKSTASVAMEAELDAAPEEYERKIIVNGDMSLETDTFDDDVSAILQAVEQAGGYVSSSSTSGEPITETGRRYGRSASYQMRIPAENYEQIVSTARQAGKVVYYHEYTDDVTDSYYDVQTRLSTYRTQYDKVTEMLTKAENIEDILSIETHLTDLMYQIESLEGQIRRWDQLVQYSTLNLDIEEVADPASIRSMDPTLSERIREGFFGGVNALIDDAQDLTVWLVSHVFTLVLWAAVIAVAWWIVVRAWRKRHPKR